MVIVGGRVSGVGFEEGDCGAGCAVASGMVGVLESEGVVLVGEGVEGGGVKGEEGGALGVGDGG